MKKRYLLPLSILSILAMVGCSSTGSDSTTDTSEEVGNTYDYNEEITIDDPSDIEVEETTAAFELTTSDGAYSQSGTTYTLTSGGTYTLTGKL